MADLRAAVDAMLAERFGYGRLLGRNLRIAEMRQAMGIDWMTRDELSQAIPPAYTRFIGEQLLTVLATRSAP